MKVLTLGCGEGHSFEGWFGSEQEFGSQRDQGLVECPFCADKAIEKLPSAPRLNVAHLRGEPPRDAATVQQVQVHWMQAVRRLMDRTEDVGERFPEEARRIHYGETEERGIRGRASAQDAQALREEGIEVMAIPLPAALKGPVQ
jgi:hypothetical protein